VLQNKNRHGKWWELGVDIVSVGLNSVAGNAGGGNALLEVYGAVWTY